MMGFVHFGNFSHLPFSLRHFSENYRKDKAPYKAKYTLVGNMNIKRTTGRQSQFRVALNLIIKARLRSEMA